ncbi:hypothetical protein [Salinibacterium sp. M195]|uniref:hypothetical protein n=1 Tax=Salinibacterium sp. M195 TaxID=2583374 RepID=UPI001C63442D|nr:hypothetical protein [Salinibacterium sp. M195]QYH35101.1 hypothetical protein FFT87_03555 [Salinibacterium sp. M195]
MRHAIAELAHRNLRTAAGEGRMTPTLAFVFVALGVMIVFFGIASWRRRRSNDQDRDGRPKDR